MRFFLFIISWYYKPCFRTSWHCFRTSYPVLELPILFENILFCYRTSFSGLGSPNTVLELRAGSSVKFEHTNKRAGWNKCAGGNFFSKSINVQTKIRPCRGDFFLKINKRASTSIRYTRVVVVYKCFHSNVWCIPQSNLME